ncbi:epsin [Trypanosoma rangeli SC58]|uniref:Epsin n=1 Tax=Trypanosoma rangeli SC58 TaxID=429131 RepID=A0A061IT02_TRYRA|nr:epsin [Trypanosoma rangeli SC58]
MNIPTSIHAARELIRVKASGNEFVLLVHEATNWEPWGPTGTQMDEVCRAFSRGSVDIMEEIKLRLKNRDKSWRPCYKSLLLLDHLARNVPESGLPAVCSVIPMLRTISQSFYYTGSKGTDHGLSVRERAKRLCDLLSDSALLREEREKAALTRFKLSGASGSGGGDYSASRYQGYSRNTLPSSDLPPSAYELHTHATRTKEEQERNDMELATRLQREEEMRAGMSAADVEQMFHRQLPRQHASVAQAARDSDHEIARRLQEEEQKRQERHTSEALRPAQGTSTRTPAKPPSPKTAAPAPKPEHEPPKKDFLDDLFAPAPVMTTTTSAQQPTWTNSAPLQQQTLASVDPFDAFLDARIQSTTTVNSTTKQMGVMGRPFFDSKFRNSGFTPQLNRGTYLTWDLVVGRGRGRDGPSGAVLRELGRRPTTYVVVGRYVSGTGVNGGYPGRGSYGLTGTEPGSLTRT